jgi:cobalt-zinc-cadmium efflux system protein
MVIISTKHKENSLIKCMILTFIAMIVEVYYGYITNCLVLFSDGIHMLSHVFSLFVSFAGFYLYRKTQSNKYGIRAAILNSFSLILFSIPLFIEALNRLFNPETIDLYYSFIIGFIGLFVNLICAYMLNKSGVEDLNSKSAYMHMIGDLLTSISVILGVVIIYFLNWKWIDPIFTFILCFFMIYWGIDLSNKIFKSKNQVVL